MPPQWGSIETITTNVRQEQFSLRTGFYNFVNEVWIEPTHLFGKLTIASLAAWFNIYSDWSQIVFCIGASGTVMDGATENGEALV